MCADVNVLDIHVAFRCTAVPQHTGDPLIMSSGFYLGDQTAVFGQGFATLSGVSYRACKANYLTAVQTAEIPFSGRSARSGQGTAKETNQRTRCTSESSPALPPPEVGHLHSQGAQHQVQPVARRAPSQCSQNQAGNQRRSQPWQRYHGWRCQIQFRTIGAAAKRWVQAWAAGAIPQATW
jgi:hypothetical protein